MIADAMDNVKTLHLRPSKTWRGVLFQIAQLCQEFLFVLEITSSADLALSH